MSSGGSYPIEEFLEAITAQLDQTQDALQLRNLRRSAGEDTVTRFSTVSKAPVMANGRFNPARQAALETAINHGASPDEAAAFVNSLFI